ncbi:MAG: response regulator, partial [Anaerolineae bacterium]|nr:response regulator [Anaerolineae bacterium]
MIFDSDILIIDDVYENLALLDRLLALKGYQVRVARDGVAGLRAARAQPPDLILLDVRLPNIDGYAICAEMKADPDLCDIPILFISVAQDVASKLQAFAVGGVDYVTKPFHTHEVLARVETHLTLSHLRQQEKKLLLMKERQRLARELHDSVNQTLFLISSIAEAVQLQGKVASEPINNQLAQLQQLSQVAMAEMRVMLFELRPDTLVETPLEKLLRQLAASLASRTLGEIAVIAAPLNDTLPDDI